jgi:hypothetical protein
VGEFIGFCSRTVPHSFSKTNSFVNSEPKNLFITTKQRASGAQLVEALSHKTGGSGFDSQ